MVLFITANDNERMAFLSKLENHFNTDNQKGRWSSLNGLKECFGILAECGLYLHLELKFLELLKEINTASALGVLAKSDWLGDLILAQANTGNYDMAITMYKHLESLDPSLQLCFWIPSLRLILR